MRISDWSSDVCSSDLRDGFRAQISLDVKEAAAAQSLRRMACASARGVAAELGETARVAVEQSVPALRLVLRIPHIGAIAIPEAMVAMRRARLAVPRPETDARDLSAGPHRRPEPLLAHPTEAGAPG